VTHWQADTAILASAAMPRRWVSPSSRRRVVIAPWRPYTLALYVQRGVWMRDSSGDTLGLDQLRYR
jgi:hypothetical protein